MNYYPKVSTDGEANVALLLGAFRAGPLQLFSLKRVLLLLNACVILLFLSTVLLAQEEPGESQEPPPKAKKETPSPVDKGVPVIELPEMTVTGEKPLTSASDTEFRALDFLHLPRRTPSDLLRIVPGIHISQHTGGGKAHQIFLRGFDCEHGQDFAGYLDDIPLNQASQVHGEGYLDLHFLIPETAEKISVIKGPYDPQYGNYAVAGVMNIQPAYGAEGSEAKVEYGSFQTVRGLARFSLGKSHMLSVEADGTDGFTDPGHMKAARLFTSHLFRLGKNKQLKLLFTHYNSEYGAADVVPVDLIERGLIDRYGSMDDTDGGETLINLLGLKYEHKQDKSTFTALVHAGYIGTGLFSNYTYYLFDQTHGDQMRLNERRFSTGIRLKNIIHHKVLRKECITTVGFDGRFDRVNQSQDQTQRREPFNTLADYEFGQTNLGLYLKEDIKLNDRLRWVPGIRWDYFYYRINGTQDMQYLDVIDNKIKVRDDERKSARKYLYVFSPKSSLIVELYRNPKAKLSRGRLFLNYGEGFTSPRANLIANKEADFIPKSRCGEISARLDFFKDTLTLSPGLWMADKEMEMVFEPETGISTPRGASRRMGLDFEARYRMAEDLYFFFDYFRTSAKFKRDNTDIPGTPEETAAFGLSFRKSMITHHAGHSHTESLGFAFRTRISAPRPLGSGRHSRHYTVTDVMLSYKIDNWSIELSVENLFNQQWDDTSFYYRSRVSPTDSEREQKHITPGTPFTLKLSVTFSF